MKAKRKLKALILVVCLTIGILPMSAFAQSTLVWPVPGHTATNPVSGFHNGNAIDITDGSIYGADVVAAMSGTVSNIWLCPDNHYPNIGDCNGFGTGLVIYGDDGRYYQYAHMVANSIPSNVYYGARVAAGQKIGQVGNTGNSSGAHLHFGISLNHWYEASGINPSNENYTYDTPGVTVSLTWGNEDCQWDTTNAYMYAEADTNVSGSFTEAGITVWNEAGQVVASKSENPGLTGTHLNVWYNITNDTGVVLNPGTNYTYQFYTVFNGTRYESSVRSFRTNPVGPSVNSWTQELSISDWTYGQEASVPSASAQYGEVVYTYSTEEDGEYTTVVPQSAGTYYVKASVAGTDQYTGLEAIKEFHINKAVPVYTVPENVTAVYGQTLADIALEDHFVWLDNTESVGDVGEKSFLASYVPEDSNNYSIVNNIEIPVIVQPKDLSNINLSGVDEDTDLDSYEIKDGDTVLVKDTDYTITSVKDGKEVTVTVEFIGNYTGTVQTTYLLKDEHQNQTEDKTENGNNNASGKNTDNKNTDNSKAKKENNEAKAPKTGDVSPIAVWTIMIAVSGLAVKMICKRRMTNR